MTDIARKNDNTLATQINSFIQNTGLEDSYISINTKTGTATITGTKDGLQYTTTVQQMKQGFVQNYTAFSKNMCKSVLIEQVKELRNQGYKQNDIATFLGISQSSVSNYLNGR